MKQLIEYKLWAGQIPYFVADPLGGVHNGGKNYGVSKDTQDSYLPDTVKILTLAELTAIVLQANLTKESGGDPFAPMTDAEKRDFLHSWLSRNDLLNTAREE